ncbi:MAG: beta strand repeat-containing protein [Steroidobacteraceae bacterium]
MRNLALILVMLVAAASLAACGGDNGSAFASQGGSGTGSGSTTQVAMIGLGAASLQVPADGSAGTLIQAMALDSNNNAVPNATVSFGASRGGALQNETTTTDANGIATATLYAAGAAAGSSITVTAAAGSAHGTLGINVVKDQQTVTVLASAPQLPSDSSTAVTITAIVRNASNQLEPNVAVNFVASSGGITPVQTTAGAAASVAAGTTDANGTAAASLTPAGDPSNRVITVTATAGTSSGTVNVAVIGSTLTVTGPSSLVLGSSATYTVALTDSGSNGIGNTALNVSSALGNTVTPASLVTDSTGHATFQLTATMAGSDTVTAAGLGLTATQALSVSSQNFNFTAPAANASVDIGSSQAVKLVWTNGGVPVANQTVSFSSTRGTVTSTAMTDATGTANVLVSSTTAGPAVITASATDGGVSVTAQLPLNFIAMTPASLDLQASPATVPVQGQSTISAIVRDASNNLVQGQTVNFTLTDNTGGTLSVGSAVTDVQGRAQVVYTASTTASAANGVQIAATVLGTSVTNTVYLTVGGQTLFLSLGTGNTISENTSKTQFILPYAVQALDSGGNAVSGVQITLTVHSLPPDDPAPGGSPDFTASSSVYAAYAKGIWTKGTSSWVQSVAADCLNEDVDGTGIFESSEDLNANGKLDPGDVAAVSPGTVTTDSTGSANVTITYPEDHAAWVQVRLTATATVAGTQTSTTSTFWLPMLASYLTNLTVTPPGVVSPYGIAASCADPN